MNEYPSFTGRNVPIAEIANALGVSVDIIQLGIEYGDLKFGTKIGSGDEVVFICPDKKVWEEIGYFNDSIKKG